MKSTLFFLFFFLFVFTACKKDRTCECTYNGVNKSTITIEQKSKKDSEKECSSYTKIVSGVSIACELK